MATTYDTAPALVTDKNMWQEVTDAIKLSSEIKKAETRQIEELIWMGANIVDLVGVFEYETVKEYLKEHDHVLGELQNINRPRLRTEDAA